MKRANKIVPAEDIPWGAVEYVYAERGSFDFQRETKMVRMLFRDCADTPRVGVVMQLDMAMQLRDALDRLVKTGEGGSDG